MIRLFITLFFIGLTATLSAEEGFMYGKVTSVDGSVYVGLIRWGEEEVFWNDVFNSVKTGSKSYSDQYNRKTNNQEVNWNIFEIWEDEYQQKTHQFKCRFGDIKTIRILSSSAVALTFKNDLTIEVRGGSNDINTSVHILDQELGELKMHWDRISKIEFLPCPKELKYTFGEPLYGIVETAQGKIEGYIQWDNDERVGEDKLDGRSSTGQNYSIPFKNINAINNNGSSSRIKVKGDRVLNLSGSNDVNQGNRGIIISREGVGKIEVPWKAFFNVQFLDETGEVLKSYQEYQDPARLYGQVKILDGNVKSGYILYDLDEEWDFEMLDGEKDGIVYTIPFRNIASITPRNLSYSWVKLKNGENILLGKLRDVTGENDGVLIFQDIDQEPEYIPWKKVEAIEFK